METTAILNARQAISRHVQWKIALQLAVIQREQLTAEQIDGIEHPHQCSIGRWLNSPVNVAIQTHPAFRDLANRHLQFHQEMMTVARLIAAECFTQAAARMDKLGEFTQAGQALALAITALDRAVPIAIPRMGVGA